MNIVEKLVQQAVDNFERQAGTRLPAHMRLMFELMVLRGFCGCFEYMTEGLAKLPDEQADRAMQQLAQDLQSYVEDHARRAGM